MIPTLINAYCEYRQQRVEQDALETDEEKVQTLAERIRMALTPVIFPSRTERCRVTHQDGRARGSDAYVSPFGGRVWAMISRAFWRASCARVRRKSRAAVSPPSR
jgi:hypothetical protein